MPRARKTASGAPAQAIQSVPGQRYGEGVQSAALQQQMPMPNAQAGAEVTATDASASPAAAVTPPSPQERYAAQLAAAQATTGAGLLAQPTARPDEVVTAGMPIGPGPGAEAIQPIGGTPTAMFFEQVARLTGNGYYAQLGRRAAP